MSRDPGKYAFESDIFKHVFPHKLILYSVECQKEVDLIQAINELCTENPSEKSETFLKYLSRPIPIQEDTVFIFANNFDMDFFNYEKLHSMPSEMKTFRSEDDRPCRILDNHGSHSALHLRRMQE